MACTLWSRVRLPSTSVSRVNGRSQSLLRPLQVKCADALNHLHPSTTYVVYTMVTRATYESQVTRERAVEQSQVTHASERSAVASNTRERALARINHASEGSSTRE